MVTKPSSLSRPTVSSSWRFHWDSLSTSAICMLPSTSAYFFPACHHICRLCSRDALDTAIDLLHQRLRIAIGEETDRTVVVNMILDTINYFDPIRTKTIQEFCFLWITDILNSRWTAEEQYQTAGRAVELAWKRIAPEIISIGFCDVKTDWVPPPVGFLTIERGDMFHRNPASVRCARPPDLVSLLRIWKRHSDNATSPHPDTHTYPPSIVSQARSPDIPPVHPSMVLTDGERLEQRSCRPSSGGR